MARIKTNIHQLEAALKDLAQEQMPFAVSTTINKIVFPYVISDMKDFMSRDDSTGGIKGGAERWSLQGMSYQATRKGLLKGKVYFKKDRSYMQELIFGGTKKARKKVLPEPGDYSLLDGRGNYPRGRLGELYASGKLSAGSKFQPVSQPSKRGPGFNRKGKMITGSKSIQIFTSKRSGITGIWDFSKKKSNGAPTLLVFLSRPSRPQRQTFNAVERAREAFEDKWNAAFPGKLKSIVTKEIANRINRTSKSY